MRKKKLIATILVVTSIFTTVFIGNKTTELDDVRKIMLTKRGYDTK